MTARTRLFLTFSAALTLVLGAFSTAVYFGVERSLIGTLDDELRVTIKAVERGLAVHAEELDLGLGAVSPTWPLTEVVRVRDGAVVYRSDEIGRGSLSKIGDRVRDYRGWRAPRGAFLADGRPARLMATRVTRGGEQFEVWMGESLESISDEHGEFAAVLAVVFPSVLALAILMGYWLTGRAVGPVEEALSATRRFAADASHQLRTPLSIIRVECDVSLRKQRSADEYRATIRSILEEADRLTVRTAQLLDLSRVDSPGGLQLERRELDMSKLVQELCDEFAPVAEAKGVHLVCDANVELRVTGDADRVREMVRNVVHNAIKYTDAGGRIELRLGMGYGGASIHVADSGRGIAREHLPRVFDRFYRADASGDGAGLGLAIARAIAEAHGGSMGVSSEPGAGTCVTMTLP